MVQRPFNSQFDMKQTKMIKRIAILCFVALLTCCATVERFEMIYGSWKGSHIDEFVNLYGPPVKIMRSDSMEDIYVWDLKSRNCRIFWTVDQGKIMKKFTHEGNDCKQEPNII
jgi:hypothetical protein